MFSLVYNIYVDDTNIISELLMQMDCIIWYNTPALHILFWYLYLLDLFFCSFYCILSI